jgi:tRNA 5-methylaminomethyl-2-thiouridine biosynthesis bifunctional protein
LQISKKSLFDFAVIGAGISGASTAYFLKKYGKKVIVIDKGKIASGGSGTAGAFLSPKICSNSVYTSFVNDAFKFSVDFYKENFPQFLNQSGILRLLKSEDDIQKCKQYEKTLPIDFKYMRAHEIENINETACQYGGYFFGLGSTVDSVGVINSMLLGIEVIEDLHLKILNYQGGCYDFAGIKAKGVVICTGKTDEFEEISYIGLKNIYGHRLDVSTSTKIPFHLHKSCSISASKQGMVHIGATHIPSYIYDAKEDYTLKVDEMIELAKSYVDFENFKLEDIHFGVRNSTLDFFPALGRVINAKKTLLKYPYIKKGTMVPKEKYEYYDDLYIHSGLGARGFVWAPKTADILVQNICNTKQIDKKLDTTRLFLKYAKNI